MSEIGGIPMGWIVLLFIVVYCFMLKTEKDGKRLFGSL